MGSKFRKPALGFIVSHKLEGCHISLVHSLRVSLFDGAADGSITKEIKMLMQRTALEIRRVALVYLVPYVLRVETGQHHVIAISEQVLKMCAVPAPTLDAMV